MKRLLLLALLTLVAGCGDGDDGEDKKNPRRIVDAGSLFQGPVGGRNRFVFTDGSRIELVVSGQMHIETPQGVFLEASFPASVSYNVLSTTGEAFKGETTFERIAVGEDARFRGEIDTSHGKAVIVGAFITVTDSTYIDLQAFSFPLGATAGVESEELVLSGARLRETTFSPAP